MFGLGPATKVYLAAGSTDLRKGFEGNGAKIRLSSGETPRGKCAKHILKGPYLSAIRLRRPLRLGARFARAGTLERSLGVIL
jgi:hypothetical protein